MIKLIIQSIRQTIVWSFIAGVAYTVAMTIFAQAAFHDQANGSLVQKNGKVIGSVYLAPTLGLQLRNRADGHIRVQREQSRTDQRGVENKCVQQYRGVHQRKQLADQHRGPSRHGVCLGQRTGSAHQP
jgi:K+-transporting ATPase c subunit